jgi:hypothetical protein
MERIYYKLRCETCSVDFAPVLATSREELLSPDYDECRESVGFMNTEGLERFHSAHAGHALEAVVEE